MSQKRKPVFGVGINDVYDDYFGGKTQPKYYKIWKGVLQRCYSLKLHQKYSTYKNCTISSEWIYLSNFKKWFEENYVENWCLDKDVLYPGNKHYSSNKCIYVPHGINCLFTFSNRIRGKYPLGVSYDSDRQKFGSKFSIRGIKSNTKRFYTINEAHFWYLEQKINAINQYLEEDYSDKIKTGLRRWKELLTYHITNQVIFDPDNINNPYQSITKD